VAKPPSVPKSEPASVATSSPPAIPAPTVAPTAQNQAQTTTPAPQVAQRQIKLKTPFWECTLSNQGGVLSEWTMTHFTNDEPIDKSKGGVKLIPDNQEFGAPFRLYIPSDRGLEKE